MSNEKLLEDLELSHSDSETSLGSSTSSTSSFESYNPGTSLTILMFGNEKRILDKNAISQLSQDSGSEAQIQSDIPYYQHCSVPQCKTMKYILDHIKICQGERTTLESCCVPTVRLVSNWNNCTNIECPVCMPVKLVMYHLVQVSELVKEPQSAEESEETQPEIKQCEMPFTTPILVNPFSAMLMVEQTQSPNRGDVSPSRKKASLIHEYISDKKKQKELLNVMFLMSHALRCILRQMRGRHHVKKCYVTRCGIMRGILNHMRSCSGSRSCSTPQCSTFKLIMNHWKYCVLPDCQVCISSKGIEMNFVHMRRLACHYQLQPQEKVPTFSSIHIKTPGNTFQNKKKHESEDEKKIVPPSELLVLLLHAEKCLEEENQSKCCAKCSVQYCENAKDVLIHISNCIEGKSCPVLHCAASKHVFIHWLDCIAQNCSVCLDVKDFFNL